MNTLKKSFCILLAVLLSFSCLTLVSFAADGKISVSLTVEGIKETLFDGKVELNENATALDAVVATGLELTVYDSEYGPYLAGINGETAGSFYGVDGCKGWDGWQFSINGIAPDSVTTSVSDGDEVLFYYGDQWGVGMQFPQLKFDLVKGIITITSEDSAGWGEPVETKPVVGATLTFGGQKFISDENGQVKLPAKLCKSGTYSYNVEKYSQGGIPLVLRTHGTYTNNLSIVQVVFNFLKIVIEAIQNLFKR